MDASRKGEVVYEADGAHWASTGHTIAAEILANRLRFALMANRSAKHK